jgi:hypothetical protein
LAAWLKAVDGEVNAGERQRNDATTRAARRRDAEEADAKAGGRGGTDPGGGAARKVQPWRPWRRCLRGGSSEEKDSSEGPTGLQSLQAARCRCGPAPDRGGDEAGRTRGRTIAAAGDPGGRRLMAAPWGSVSCEEEDKAELRERATGGRRRAGALRHLVAGVGRGSRSSSCSRKEARKGLGCWVLEVKQRRPRTLAAGGARRRGARGRTTRGGGGAREAQAKAGLFFGNSTFS